MAAPFVTGSFAVLKQRFPYLSNGDISTILKTTTTDFGEPGVDEIYGLGLINLKKALKGPGQLIDRVEVNLPAGYEDVWSNDISEAALLQRKAEEKTEVANWKAKKIANGWENGFNSNITPPITNELLEKIPAVEPLLLALSKAHDDFLQYDLSASDADPQHFLVLSEALDAATSAALVAFNAVHNNPDAANVWTAYRSYQGSSSYNQADYRKFKAAVRDYALPDAKRQYDAYEEYIAYLEKKDV